MDLTCYLYPGWKPNIRPASPRRQWMDGTPEAFAYRCLPLNIANAHGWEVLSPTTFEARWSGGPLVEDVTVRLPEGLPQSLAPVSLFGQGTVTFHIPGLFRTPPGWNLWIGGSPNEAKDGIAPLSGIVETDWSPFTFTMNWRFTRPDTWVRFEEGEPICFVFPVQRGVLETVEPRFVEIESDPALKAEFEAWSRGRDEFQTKIAAQPPKTPSEKWQKHYYRGVDTKGRTGVEDHQGKLRLAAFKPAITPARWTAPPEPIPAAPEPKADPATTLALRKREWLLEVMEAHRHLVPEQAGIARYEDMTREEFLTDFYAAGRPVVLGGEMKDWPAMSRWSPEYLAKAVGSAVVEFQGDRNVEEQFEIYKERYRREMAFDRFIEMITEPGSGNRAYLTAYNSARNQQALAPLQQDLGVLDKYLMPGAGMMWIGPAGTFTPLHHDLTNNFMLQVVGRKQVMLAPAAEVGKLYNNLHVFSEIADLQAPPGNIEDYPRLGDLRFFDVLLEPGDVLFIPIGWWHQVRSLDFSVTVTHTNFLWRNDWSVSYPSG